MSAPPGDNEMRRAQKPEPVQTERVSVSERATRTERGMGPPRESVSGSLRGEAAQDWNAKAEAVRLWNADPCGGAVGQLPEGSAAFYDAVAAERYGSYAPWLPAAVDVRPFSGQRVLEIGCGLGTDLMRFARAGATTFAVDLTPRHLRLTQQRLRAEGYAARLVRSDAEGLPLGDACLDAVYSFGVLHHTPRMDLAVAEIHRVLRPGGTAIVAVYHRRSLFYAAWMARALGTGDLFRRGYRRVMADVEQHPHSDAAPLVDVLTRGECRRMFAPFARVEISAHHFAYSAPVTHMVSALRLGAAASARLERLFGRFGWYLLIRAER
jgi:ubiquinone/menaquinone biosynthesis C-methylase UbiE